MAGDIPDGLQPDPARLSRIALTIEGNSTISESSEVSDEGFGGNSQARVVALIDLSDYILPSLQNTARANFSAASY